MRRASTLASSVFSRTLAPTYDGGATTTNRRLLQAALYCTGGAGGSYNHNRWFYRLSNSFSARAASVGVAGALVSVAATTFLAQEAYAKEPPPQELVPKDVVLYQYEACPFCNKVKGLYLSYCMYPVLNNSVRFLYSSPFIVCVFVYSSANVKRGII